MNIPNLPTDSLYKFLALAGLTMMLVSMGYSEVVVGRLEDEVVNAEERVALLRKNAYFLNERIERVRNWTRRAGEQAKEENLHFGRALERARNQARRTKHMRRVAQDLELEFIKIEASTRRLNNLGTRAKSALILRWLLTSGGLVLAYLGFSLWYRKVQLPTDRLLEQKARALLGNEVSDSRPSAAPPGV